MSAEWIIVCGLLGIIWLIAACVYWSDGSNHPNRTPRMHLLISLGWPVHALWFLTWYWPWHCVLRPLITNQWQSSNE